ncbi:MAG: hypothetical protein JWQ32_2063 [Marmoricola sp.]|nr:hypothetical protein [Marmoricola sp.]
MRFSRLAAFWGAVAGVSIVAPVMFNLAADRLGTSLPALKSLNDYATRRNG